MDVNSSLNTYWKQLGNQGDRPAGWFGPGGSPDAPNYGAGSPGYAKEQTQSYDAVLKSIPKTQDFAQTLNQGENNAFNDYLSYLKSQPTSAENYSKNLEAAGVPSLQKAQTNLIGQMNSLEDAIRNVEPQVAATTQNSFVTQGQRQGIIQEKLNPLQQNYGTVSTALGRVSQAVSQGKADALTLTNLTSEDQKRLSDAYLQKLTLAQSQGTRALQAFIQDSDNYLNVSLAKLHRGEALSDQEAAFAHDLLMMQQEADQRMKEIEAGKQEDNGLLTLSEGQTIFDPVTMQELFKNPKSYKATGGGSGETFD